jgi:hypothetical protein
MIGFTGKELNEIASFFKPRPISFANAPASAKAGWVEAP